MNVNTNEDRKAIFGKLQVSISIDVIYFYLQGFLTFWQFPYVYLMKCEEIIHQIKNEA